MDTNVIRDLVEQNKKLMTHMIEMQEKKKPNTPAGDEAEAEQAEPKPRRTTHPRVKPVKPQLRRSPRNHSPAPTPSGSSTIIIIRVRFAVIVILIRITTTMMVMLLQSGSKEMILLMGTLWV